MTKFLLLLGSARFPFFIVVNKASQLFVSDLVRNIKRCFHKITEKEEKRKFALVFPFSFHREKEMFSLKQNIPSIVVRRLTGATKRRYDNEKL